MWNTELWGKRYKKSGRIGRLDYFKSQLFILAIATGLGVLSFLTLSKVLICVSFIYGCIYLWLTFCLIAKRLHDIGLSSWMLLIPILLTFRLTINSGAGSHTYSILGMIFGNMAGYISLGIFIAIFIALISVKGTKTDNKYGKALK